MKTKGNIGPVRMLAAMMVLAPAVQAADVAPVSVATSAPDPAAVSALVATINNAIATLPASATSQDVEAKIAFAIDQSGASANVVAAALDQAVAAHPKGKVNVALQNIRSSHSRQAGLGGTGALAGGGGVDLAAGPSVGGGGGSDYTAAR